jgi:chromate transporter
LALPSSGGCRVAAGRRDAAVDAVIACCRSETGGVPSWRRAARVTAVCLLLWFAPLLVLQLWLGNDHVIVREGLFFSQTAVVTFGGAYAVLAYVAQRAVEQFAWLQPAEMLDGLALAETTPGPLIMVLQFVGFVAAYRHAGVLDPWTAAMLGAAVTTWVTFVPCFLFVFVGAPYVEALRRHAATRAALSCITAAVVGVVLNLSAWFALHSLFGEGGPSSGWCFASIFQSGRACDRRPCCCRAWHCSRCFGSSWALAGSSAEVRRSVSFTDSGDLQRSRLLRPRQWRVR